LTSDRGLCRLRGLSGQIEMIVVSPDGQCVAALAQNWQLGVWDLETGRLRFRIDVPRGSHADNAGLAFSRDNRRLAYSVSTDERGTALLIDAANGGEVRRWSLPSGLQNRFGFEESGSLWYFQVELERGEALPLSNYPWRQYPRVGRLRDLSGLEPTKVLHEVRAFPRGVLRAAITTSARYTLMEGIGDKRAVVSMDNASGRTAELYLPASRADSSNLIVDTNEATAWFTDASKPGTYKVDVLDGTPHLRSGVTPIAANAKAGIVCSYTDQRSDGCFLMELENQRVLANLCPGVGTHVAAFDASGRKLVYGGRDGSVVVCHLERIRQRLAPLGLAW
jgi:hypothetical protein